MLEVCTVGPNPIHFEFFSETVGEEAKIILSHWSGDEFRITSVSEKNLLFLGIIGSIQYTVPSEAFEPELSILKYFKLVSVLLYYSGNLSKYSVLVFKEIFSGCWYSFHNKYQGLKIKIQGW